MTYLFALSATFAVTLICFSPATNSGRSIDCPTFRQIAAAYNFR